MSNGNGQPQETMTGLAKRWLKTQLTFHGDPIRSRREQEEARAIEQRMQEKQREDAQRAAVEALIPPSWKRKMSDWQRQSEEREVERAAERRARHDALPRATTTIRLSGDVTGAATIDLPVTLQLPGEEDHALIVTLLPVDPVEINGHAFIGIQFAIPQYTGTGEIDLTSLAGDNWTESWDPLWFQLWLDNDDESFFWSPGYGRAVASIDASAEVLAIEMEMYDAASRHITVALSADLPPGSLRY